MKVEEPTLAYHSQPTVSRLKGQIIKSVEHEMDIHALNHLWSVIEQMKKNDESRPAPRRLAALNGILNTKKSKKTYKVMRDEHMKEKYGL